MLEYYSLRRLNPYLGLIQVIDLGPVRAYCDDGNNWFVRRIFDMEAHWHQYDPEAKVSRRRGQQAIAEHPGLPFPRRDRYELWLLRKSDLSPLALLKSCRWAEEMDTVRDPHWYGPGGVRADFYVEGQGSGHGNKQRLEQMIRWAAFPQPVVQWFERHEDGSGTGLQGMRVDATLEGRSLPREAFPELLISETWNTEEEATLARGFHDWYAAALLVHPDLSDASRQRLERSVIRNPLPLLNSYHLIPRSLDKKCLEVAMVAARLIKNR